MCEHCNRREFIERCASGILLASAMPWQGLWAANGKHSGERLKKVKVVVIYTGEVGPADRGWNADQVQFKEIETTLTNIEQRLTNIELLRFKTTTAQEVISILDQIEKGTPLLFINLNIFAMWQIIRPALERRHPIIVFSLPASGHDWMYPPRWRKEGYPITLFPTSDYEALETAIRLLRVVPLLKQTRILLFPPARGTPQACDPTQIRKVLGPEVIAVEQVEFDRILSDVDSTSVEKEAKRWKGGAKKILGPTEEDILKAARVSVALERLMDEYNAHGLAVGTCMGWLERGFPCLGFSKLRDKGLPAACEGDMDSLLTMLIYGYAFDKPGFQGNQTFDISKNTLWTAHCTAPLKMDGPTGPEAPYILRGHSEVGGSGCVPEVKFRIGQVITRAKLVHLETILISTAEIVEVPEISIHGCRSQLISRVKDAEKMALNWSLAINSEDPMTLLHRVVFYGNYLKETYHLATLLGLKVVEEG